MSLAALVIAAPLLVKTSVSGYVPPEWQRSERCEIYPDKVVITKTYSGSSVKTQLPFSGEDAIQKLLSEAKKDELKETENELCDGPGTLVEAGDLILYASGGCGSPKEEREGAAAQALLDIVGTFCPKTN